MLETCERRVQLTRVSRWGGCELQSISAGLDGAKPWSGAPLTWGKPKPRSKRTLKLAFVAGGISLIAALVLLGLRNFTNLPPPELSQSPPPRRVKVLIVNGSQLRPPPTIPNPTQPASSFSSVCSECGEKEVCLQVRGRSRCLEAVDLNDPTGCGGLCIVGRQRCQLLDAELGVWACLEPPPMKCAPGRFKCAASCVAASRRCDGLLHCEDGADEKDCACDLSTSFRCGRNTSCVALWRRCDGSVDCWDATDEKNCSNAACTHQEFPCLSGGTCVPFETFCDGRNDCLDGSDEPIGCANTINQIS